MTSARYKDDTARPAKPGNDTNEQTILERKFITRFVVIVSILYFLIVAGCVYIWVVLL